MSETKQPTGREIVEQIIKESHPGPECICDDCLIMTLLGTKEARERVPGSFLVEHPNKDASKSS